MYRVLSNFSDLQDKEYVYRAGDEYPRPGFSVSADRIDELATGKNRIGFPLIEEISVATAKNDETGPKEPVSEAEEKPADVLPQKTKARRRGRKPAE